MKYKALTQVALGWLLCLGLAIPATAQQRGGQYSTGSGNSSGSGGGSAQPQRSSPPPSPPPAPAPQVQRSAPPQQSYSPPAQVQSQPAPQVQRSAPPQQSYSPPAQVQSQPAPQVQRGAPQSYTPQSQPSSVQRGNPQGSYTGQPQSNGNSGQFKPNATGTSTTQRGGQYRAPLSFKPNNPGATSRLYPNGGRDNNNTNYGFNFRRGNNTSYRSYPGLRYGRNYVSPRPRGFFYNNRGFYNTYYTPQLGFNINTLPYGYYPFYYGADQYYYSDGLYYAQQDNSSYTVVEPPVGATISKLPAKAQPITINGMKYYEHNGIYYQPVTRDDGTLVYQIAGKDGELNTQEDMGIAPEDLPQVGDMVDHLPEGFKILRLNNQRFYVSQEGYYFQDAVDTNGDPVFKIVGTPYDTIEN
ncbi:MAG: DUF6515 family protein [Bacteroidota bacterium]